MRVALLAVGTGSLPACDDLGYALAVTASIEEVSVSDEQLVSIKQFSLSVMGDGQSYAMTKTLDQPAKRTERLLWTPQWIDTEGVTVTVAAEDASGAIIARGVSAGVKLPQGKATYVDMELTAPVTGIDGGVDASVGDAGGTIPAAARNAGYTTLTFDSTTLGTTTGTWQPFTFYNKQMPGSAIQNDGGSITLTGINDSGSSAIATAAPNASKPERFQGIAFGGGAYFEITMSFPGTPDGGVGPQIYAPDIEHITQFMSETTYGASWVDVYPFVANNPSDKIWDVQMHNYYFEHDMHSNASPPGLVGVNGTVPNGGNFSALHTYAFLWIPATEMNHGRVTFYCDNIEVSGSAEYQLYADMQTFPPTSLEIENVLDRLHLMLTISTPSKTFPVVITAARVWQGPGRSNLTY